jgi:aminoglycoside 3-N-acetyltransferase
VTLDGRRVWASYEDIEFDTGDFVMLGAAFAATGGERAGRIGYAEARLMKQRALVDFAAGWMARHRPRLG